MKFTWVILPFSILCAATLLVLQNFYFSSYRLIVFSVVMIATCTFLVRLHKPTDDAFDGSSPVINFVCGEKEDDIITASYTHGEEDDQKHDYQSEGYTKYIDDDEEEQEEEGGENLEERIEEFIAKVRRGWREELLESKVGEEG
ncbi:hypothetical protein NMG60_11030368 [Bertholletia excelsa]